MLALGDASNVEEHDSIRERSTRLRRHGHHGAFRSCADDLVSRHPPPEADEGRRTGFDRAVQPDAFRDGLPLLAGDDTGPAAFRIHPEASARRAQSKIADAIAIEVPEGHDRVTCAT